MTRQPLKILPLPKPKQVELFGFWFDGSTYDPELDEKRLTKQIYRVWAHMAPGQWDTLRNIADHTGASEAGVSARLRDFRKERFGGHEVERKREGGGCWQYRLIPNKGEK